MGDPGDKVESAILDFFRNNENQRAEVMKYISELGENSLTKNSAKKNDIFSGDDASGFIKISGKNHTSNSPVPIGSSTTTKPPATVAQRKRPLSPDLPAGGQAQQSQVHTTPIRTRQASTREFSSSGRLTVILGSNLPADAKKDRSRLIAAVKHAAPVGIKLGEIRLTKNDEVLVSCLTEHDHNTCLRSDKWGQEPHSFVPRFNLSASNKSIVYIKPVPVEMNIAPFEDHLTDEGIIYSNLERIKTGRDRQESMTLRLLVHDMEQKMKLIKEGILIDHQKFKVEPHVNTTIKQCFRCCGYGHLAADCKERQNCTRCGEEHGHQVCTVDRESPKCSNCEKNDAIPRDKIFHAASDRSCPTRIKILRDARRDNLRNKSLPPSQSDPSNLVPPANSNLNFPPLNANSGPNHVTVTSDTGWRGGRSAAPATAQSQFIFGERIIDPATRDKNIDKSNLLSTVLEVVSSTLTEILIGFPGMDKDSVNNSLLRSVNKLKDDSIDISIIARSLMKSNTSFAFTNTGSQQPGFPPIGSLQTGEMAQSTNLLTALSGQVTDGIFKKPVTPAGQTNKPKGKRQYNRKTSPQVQTRKARKISESTDATSDTGQLSDDSMISISSQTAAGLSSQTAPGLTVLSTPQGRRLLTGTGASPLLGRQEAPSSPDLTIHSPGGSMYKSPISPGFFVDLEGEPEADLPRPSIASILTTSLTNILQTSKAANPAVQTSEQPDIHPLHLQPDGAAATPASAATSLLTPPGKGVKNPGKKSGKNARTSKQDG